MIGKARGKIATADGARLSPVELAFFGDSFESLTGTLDSVLIIIALRRQQLDNDVAACRCGPAKCRGRIINRLTDLVLVQSHWQFGPGRRLHRRTRRAPHLER